MLLRAGVATPGAPPPDPSPVFLPPVPMPAQAAYRYIVYAAGHEAAARRGALLGLGAVLLVLDAPPACRAPALWLTPRLRGVRLRDLPLLAEDGDDAAAAVADADHFALAADGSDLDAVVDWCRGHPAAAAVVAAAGTAAYAALMPRDAQLKYMADVLRAIGADTDNDGPGGDGDDFCGTNPAYAEARLGPA